MNEHVMKNEIRYNTPPAGKVSVLPWLRQKNGQVIIKKFGPSLSKWAETLSSGCDLADAVSSSVFQARYKQSLDPTVDEVKKLCTSLRRNAKEERVLFHYNGHGVPRPTVNGEIWVFNKVRRIHLLQRGAGSAQE